MNKWYIILLLLCTCTMFAEDRISLQSNTTFGLFKNAMDAAFEVNENGTSPNFSMLTNAYIFGGLSNFDTLTATSDTETSVPFSFGFYKPGVLPISLLFSINVKTTTDDNIIDKSVSQLIATVIDVSELGTTNNNDWVQEEITQVFSVDEAMDLESSLKFIVNIGNINTGAFLNFDYKKGDIDNPLEWAENNKTLKTLKNYNLFPDNPPPVTELDYTIKETWVSPESEIFIGGSIPVYIGMEKSGHFIELGVNYTKTDNSSSYTKQYSEAVSVGPTTNFTTNIESSNDKLTGIDIKSMYKLTLQALIPTHKSNFLEISPWFNYRINIAEDVEEITQTFNYSSDYTLLSSTNTVEKIQYTLADDYSGGVNISHPLYFGLSDLATLGIKPELKLQYRNTSMVNSDDQVYGNYIVNNSNITRTEDDTDGDGIVDTTVVTTVISPSDGEGIVQIGSASFTLPMVVRIKPMNLPLEFTIGSSVLIGTNLHWYKNLDDTEKSMVQVFDSEGIVVSTTTTQITGIQETTREKFYSTWEFTQLNRLGFTFRFTDYITFDVILNSSNLWDFDDLTMQTIVALP